MRGRVTKSTSFRLSQATEDRLAWLAARYGNKTTAVAIAIDRLYEAERQGANDMRIEVRYTQDSVLGTDPEAIAELDVKASLEAYEQTVWHYIEDKYNGAEIEVVEGPLDGIRVDGEAGVPSCEDVKALVECAWNADWEIAKD